MKFIKAITTDGKTVYFNPGKILTITPKANGSATVLMGAGLYWDIRPETMVYILPADLIGNIMEA